MYSVIAIFKSSIVWGLFEYTETKMLTDKEFSFQMEKCILDRTKSIFKKFWTMEEGVVVTFLCTVVWTVSSEVSN
jgi:hypothetical protein